jgi:hypothetical protein
MIVLPTPQYLPHARLCNFLGCYRFVSAVDANECNAHTTLRFATDYAGSSKSNLGFRYLIPCSSNCQHGDVVNLLCTGGIILNLILNLFQ